MSVQPSTGWTARISASGTRNNKRNIHARRPASEWRQSSGRVLRDEVRDQRRERLGLTATKPDNRHFRGAQFFCEDHGQNRLPL